MTTDEAQIIYCIPDTRRTDASSKAMTSHSDKETAARDFVRDHIDRCISVYSDQGDKSTKVDRNDFEMMRGDLMLAIGMLMALQRIERRG